MGAGGAAMGEGAGGGMGGAALAGGGGARVAALALAAEGASTAPDSLAIDASHATAKTKKRPPPSAVSQRGVFGSSGRGSS